MTIEQAIEILRKHNEWRRGAEDIQPYAPSVIGEAIDVVVRYHSVESNEVVKGGVFEIAGLFSEEHGFTDEDFDERQTNKEQNL
jgi:hypothetical protein